MSEHAEKQNEEIKEMGTLSLSHNKKRHNIQLLTIIGEIEGHEAVSGNTKATKYEHLLPKLAEVEDSEEIEGLLILLNTLGGRCGSGTCHCRDDCVYKQTECISCAWWKPFYRMNLWQFRQIIPLSFQAEQWLFIRYGQAECSSG